MCAGSALISDCWVHDSRWFRSLFDAAGISALVHCRAVEYLLDDEQQQIYQAAKKQMASCLGLPMHRALNDAVIIQKTLQKMTGNWEHEPVEMLRA